VTLSVTSWILILSSTFKLSRTVLFHGSTLFFLRRTETKVFVAFDRIDKNFCFFSVFFKIFRTVFFCFDNRLAPSFLFVYSFSCSDFLLKFVSPFLGSYATHLLSSRCPTTALKISSLPEGQFSHCLPHTTIQELVEVPSVSLSVMM
jgi:hypothetical protein